MPSDNKLKAIRELLSLKISSQSDLMLAKRKIAGKYATGILSNSEILRSCLSIDDNVRRMLRKRSVRTISGIAPVAVLTKPYPCPGRCAYCPAEKDVPQSYLSNEPAVMRAIRCGYDPYVQVRERLRALEANGHDPAKIELIIIGGTWSVLPEKYKLWYISECFRGANDFKKNQKSKVKSQNFNSKASLEILKSELIKEQTYNEKADYRIIGITLETRPDYINEKEIMRMRELGCTRVELGVQAIDDKILGKNRRGHGVDEIAAATALLRKYGFKITYHLMPGLPGSTPAKDLAMFRRLFADPRFQPDQIKFYPTVVTKGSLLYRWWKAGKYKPYNGRVLRKLITDCKKIVPQYVRIIRLIRDIPGESIVAGNKVTNLRQVLKDNGVECGCIRCREVKDKKNDIGNWILDIIRYEAAGGTEHFIQAVSKSGKDKNNLFGFCRLFLPSDGKKRVFTVLDASAIVRELHVYGELVPVGKDRVIQHSGLGKKLLAEAERIAQEKGFLKMSVISGIGVRGYYRRAGYRLKDSYMAKKIS